MESLAVQGGPKAKKTPWGKGNRFGAEELAELREALEQGTLWAPGGRKVKRLAEAFTEYTGMKHAIPVPSGTAALHTALAGCGIGSGDEVITTCVTDMGTYIGIMALDAVPVMADIDFDTENIDACSIRSKLSERAKAIIPVHIAGLTCDMDPILDIAREFKLKIVEDCAQSYSARYKGRLAGTMGDAGCFSINDTKHISCGEGGVVVTNDNAIAYRAMLFADKCYDRGNVARPMEYAGEHSPHLSFLGMNYRLTELQAAVALAQLKKLDWVIDRCRNFSMVVTENLQDAPGIILRKIGEEFFATAWKYIIKLDPRVIKWSTTRFSEALQAEGIPNADYSKSKPAYMYRVFQNLNSFAAGGQIRGRPLGAGHVAYCEGDCPQAEELMKRTISIKIDAFFTEIDAMETAVAIKKVACWAATEA